MPYLPVKDFVITNETQFIVYMKTKDDLDAIESPLRFAVEGEAPRHYVVKDAFLYEYPGDSFTDSDLERTGPALYGRELLAQARSLAREFIKARRTNRPAEYFEVEEYLLTKNTEADWRLVDLIVRMINTEIADAETDDGVGRLDLQAEREYNQLLYNTAEIISRLPEYRKAPGEMAKKMVIKKYLADQQVPIRNNLAHQEIKAFIQAYFEDHA